MDGEIINRTEGIKEQDSMNFVYSSFQDSDFVTFTELVKTYSGQLFEIKDFKIPLDIYLEVKEKNKNIHLRPRTTHEFRSLEIGLKCFSNSIGHFILICSNNIWWKSVRCAKDRTGTKFQYITKDRPYVHIQMTFKNKYKYDIRILETWSNKQDFENTITQLERFVY